MEFQGLSDMDVARALSGQGWPVKGDAWFVPLKLRFNESIFRPKRKTGCPGQDLCALWGVCQRRSPEVAKHRVHATPKQR